MGIAPDDDKHPIEALEDRQRLHPIVSGGMGPITPLYELRALARRYGDEVVRYVTS